MIKLSIVYKFSIASVIFVLLSVGIVGVLFYNKTTELLVADALDDISIKTRNAGAHLLEHIEEQNKDALFLSRLPAIQGMLRVRNNVFTSKHGELSYQQWEEQVGVVFKVILDQHLSYLAIRFIDISGQERVVARRENGKIIITEAHALQNKAHRDYVRETIKLHPNKVYLSEINLHREYGEVSVPHQEVLRSAVPVFDEKTSKVAGLILITVEVGEQLRGIQSEIGAIEDKIYIMNDYGGYLLHPDKSMTYGFDLEQRYRIQEDVPELSKWFIPGNKENSLIFISDDVKDQVVKNFIKIFFDKNHTERFIVVGMTTNYENIYETQKGTLNKLVIQILGLVIIISLMAMLLSYRLSRPIKQITQAIEGHTSGVGNGMDLPVDRGDEVGQLARSYNVLMRQVHESEAKLKEMNVDLEEQVIIRTKKLEASELRQRSIIENMVDGLITIDSKGCIDSVNPAAIDMFGYRENEMVGRNVKMLMPEPYHSEHDAYLEDYNQTHMKKIIGIGREVEAQTKKGDIFPIELTVSEIKLDDEPLYIGLVRDITERKKMDKMKNEFISTVSHELRTPLTSIRGSLGLISGGAVGELPPAALEMLRIASNNTERLLLLINDILDIQKIESGQMVFKFKNLKLMPFLEQVLEDNAAYGDEYKVKFVIAQQVSDAQVYVDKDRMKQVMANLLSNAAKFSPDNDTIEISVAHHKDRTIRISVTDHGPGIPEDFQPKLFEKFTQSDSSDTREKGGTGLGLSITKMIIEQHGGRIGFVSHEGVGTTFYVELPEMMPALDDGKEQASVGRLKVRHNACILIVEDDRDIAALIRRMLAEAGYNSDIAYDVKQARKFLQEKPGQYRALTLDLVLPDEDGFSLLKSLREDANTQDLPVVIVSAEADEMKRELRGGAMGVIDWLQKPIDEDRLIAAVKQAGDDDSLPRVLHVEDESDVHKVVKMLLRDRCELTWAATFSAAKMQLETETFDLVLLDIGLPDGSGLDLLEVIDDCDKSPCVIIFSAYDVTKEYADKVSAVLVKSNSSNEELLAVITSFIK